LWRSGKLEEYKYVYPSTDKYRMNVGKDWRGRREEDGEINILMEYK